MKCPLEFYFKNLDTANTSFFEFQGKWNDRFTIARSLPLDYLKKDSISDVKKNDYYDFNWQNISASIHGFVTFSEPIHNKVNSGFVGMLAYLKDRFYIKTFWFDLNKGIAVKEFTCEAFKVPYYIIKLKENSVYNIIPGLLVADGPC